MRYHFNRRICAVDYKLANRQYSTGQRLLFGYRFVMFLNTVYIINL